MAKSTKSYEERMLEMEKREQESLEKAKRYAAQKKELLKRKKAEESKKLGFTTCIMPEVSREVVKNIKGIKIIGVKTINEALQVL